MSPRIAWISPAPRDGGVAGVAAILLDTLPSQGIEVDAFFVAPSETLLEDWSPPPGMRVIARDSGWRYDRWYSRSDLSKMATGLASQLATQVGVARSIAREHRHRNYAAVYQFSQPELLALRPLMSQLPPLIVHPEVHATGEARWLAHERRMGVAPKATPKSLAVEAVLRARGVIQRADFAAASRVVLPSQAFAADIQRDYALPTSSCAVVPNPIDINRFRPEPAPLRFPLTLTFLSRIAARKGVEMIVELSRRLADLEGMVRIKVVGDKSLWSDYRPLLGALNPGLADYEGARSAAAIPALLRDTDILLQPSHYEPFALTVGEAMASGAPVVVSDAVGAGERVASACCRRYRTGDVDDFERHVRALVNEVSGSERETIRALARSEAERLFDPAVVGAQVADVVRELS